MNKKISEEERNYYAKIGSMLKALRFAYYNTGSNLDQRLDVDLKKINTNRQMLYNYERGSLRISLYLFFKLIKFYGFYEESKVKLLDGVVPSFQHVNNIGDTHESK